MAKRRRLSPAHLEAVGPAAAASEGPRIGLLGRPEMGDGAGSRPGPDLRPVPRPAARAPIAEVAGGAAAAAALEELAGEVRAARADGRLVEALPLGAVEAEHLMRDRLEAEPEAMDALVASLRAHGQRAPIEVTPVEAGRGGAGAGEGPRYGLISGWRRLAALRRLHAETGEARFATVRALVRRPRDAAEAYVAMVEENEVRAQLSHYERARLVARAADAGVFADEDAALRALFASASAARRSKIKAFVPIHRALGGRLRRPAMISERLGLALAKALREEPGLAEDVAARLEGARDAEAELALLREAAGSPPGSAAKDGGGSPARPGGIRVAPRRPAGAPEAGEVRPGVRLSQRRSGGGQTIVLSGPGVDAALRERLEGWLREGA